MISVVVLVTVVVVVVVAMVVVGCWVVWAKSSSAKDTCVSNHISDSLCTVTSVILWNWILVTSGLTIVISAEEEHSSCRYPELHFYVMKTQTVSQGLTQ